MFVRTAVKLLQYLFNLFVIQHQGNWFSGYFVETPKYEPGLEKQLCFLWTVCWDIAET